MAENSKYIKNADNKRTEFLHCRLNKELANKVEQFCLDTNLSKTAIPKPPLPITPPTRYLSFRTLPMGSVIRSCW